MPYTTYSGLLKQPDKHKPTYWELRGFVLEKLILKPS